MNLWYEQLPLSLQSLAQNLLQQLLAQGLNMEQAQQKILAPASRAWLIEQGQHSRPFVVLEDAATEHCPADLLAQEVAERAAREAS